MRKILFIIILNSAFCIQNSICISQNVTTGEERNIKIDSLLKLIYSSNGAGSDANREDTTRVHYLIKLCIEYRKIGSYENSLKYGKEALALTNSFQNEQGRAEASSAYNNIGNVYYSQGNYPAALENYFASLQINKELLEQAIRDGAKDNIIYKKDIAGSFLNIGIIYYYQNSNQEALKNYFAALNISEEIGDKWGIANLYSNIGIVYDNPDNYAEALKNFSTALKLFEDIADKKNVAATYNNIGRIYNTQGNYEEALEMYTASLKINQERGDKAGMAFSFTNIGNICWNLVHYPDVQSNEKPSNSVNSLKYENVLNKAFENYSAALIIREEIGDKEGIAESFSNLGYVQFDLKNLRKAQDYLNKSLTLSKEFGIDELIIGNYYLQVNLDSALGNWKAAYQHHKQYMQYRDSINLEEARKESLQSAMNFEFEKKEAVLKSEQEIKDAIIAANSNKRRQVFLLVFFIFILIFVFAGYVFRSKRKIKNLIAEENKQSEDKKIEEPRTN